MAEAFAFEHDPRRQDASPIARALPAVYNKEPFPVPPRGQVFVSQYVNAGNQVEFLKNISDTDEWPVLRTDPAFAVIDFDSPSISQEDLHAWMQERDVRPAQDESASHQHRQSAVPRKRAYPNDDENVQPVPPHITSPRMAASPRHMREPGPKMERLPTPVIEREKTPTLDVVDDMWAPQPGEDSGSALDSAAAQEARLASLGVTGSPKPVKPQTFRDKHSARPPNGSQVAPPRKRQDSGYVSANGSYSNGIGNEYGRRDSRTFDKNNPPPPPPPDTRRRKTNGNLHSPLSEDSGREQSQRKMRLSLNTTPVEEDENGRVREESPLSPVAAELLGLGESARKRDAVPRRKRARAQPQVDAAYR